MLRERSQKEEMEVNSPSLILLLSNILQCFARMPVDMAKSCYFHNWFLCFCRKMHDGQCTGSVPSFALCCAACCLCQ